MSSGLTDDERDAVDALIEYRLRLADKPFIKPMAMSAELQAASDGVLSREHQLLEALSESCEEEVIDLLSDREATHLQLVRHQEMCALLEGGLARAARLRDNLVEMKKERDRRRALSLNNTNSAAGASTTSTTTRGGLRNANGETDGDIAARNLFAAVKPPSIANSSSSKNINNNDIANAGRHSPRSPSAHLMTRSLEDIERHVQIESALSANLERTMTVLYPTYLDFVGRIAMMRRRCDLEKDWSVATAQELEVVEAKTRALSSQEQYRKQQLVVARAQLDEANRFMFMSRKELTATHHRILGLEKLRNGAVIDAQSSIDLVNRIRRELQQHGGESETFSRLMETECAELCDLVPAAPPTSAAAWRREQELQQRQQQHLHESSVHHAQHFHPAAAAAAAHTPQSTMGATPFVLNATTGAAAASRRR